jgi:uncharacterized membrane protein required for colicin V production
MRSKGLRLLSAFIKALVIWVALLASLFTAYIILYLLLFTPYVPGFILGVGVAYTTYSSYTSDPAQDYVGLDGY